MDVESHIPSKNPFSCQGTVGPWDEEELRVAFAKANVIEVGSVDAPKASPGFFAPNAGPSMSYMSGLSSPMESVAEREVWTLKVTKVGILHRKEDTIEGGRKASSRKWRPWSVLLTGSKLLFFRDTMWANSLLSQAESLQEQILFPHTPLFRPDELLSLKNSVAVFDASYTRVSSQSLFC